MMRIRCHREAEAIYHALSLIPPRIRERLQGVDFVTGYDPAFLGLHFYHETEDGRSYTNTSHCVWPCHQLHLPRDRRRTTIVLIDCWDEHCVDIILHELGHALDEALEFQRPWVVPLDDYAEKDQFEAFAQAFRAWLNDTRENDGWFRHNREELAMVDPETCAFFNCLAEGGLWRGDTDPGFRPRYNRSQYG